MINCTIITETDHVFNRDDVSLFNHKLKAGSVHWTTETNCKLVFKFSNTEPSQYVTKGDTITVVLSSDPDTVGPYTDSQLPSNDNENIVSFDTEIKRIRRTGAIVVRTCTFVTAIERVLNNS